MATMSAGGQPTYDPRDPFGLSKPVAQATRGATGGSSGGSNGILNSLIQTLNGAVSTINPNLAARQADITATQQTQSDYNKQNAFTDAQGLMNQVLQQQMAESMPSIVSAADGAGASASSMRALLTQQAIQNAATAAAAQGGQMAVDYGNIANSSSNVLETLTRPDNTNLEALLAALRLKGDLTQQASSSAQQSGSKPRQVLPQRQQTSIGVNKNPRGSGPVTASFLPTTAAASTSSFFNRPGGIANGGGSALSVGPAKTDSQIYDILSSGLLPSQQAGGVPVPSDFFNNGAKIL